MGNRIRYPSKGTQVVRRKYQLWYKIEKPHKHRIGEILWVDEKGFSGYYKVRAYGKKELLLAPVSIWEAWVQWASKIIINMMDLLNKLVNKMCE